MFGEFPSFNPGTRPSRRQLQNVIRAVRALSNIRFGPGIYGKLTISGLTISARPMPKTERTTEVQPVSSGGGATRFGVIVAIPSDASRFVRARAIKRDEADPWAGGYIYDGDESPVACWPGTIANDYREYLWTGSMIVPPVTHILPVIKIDGDWYIQQYGRFEYRDLTGLRISDCQLVTP